MSFLTSEFSSTNNEEANNILKSFIGGNEFKELEN